MSSSQVTALIVDDEKLGRDALKVLIRNYIPEIQVVGLANSVSQAVPLIEKLKPEIVFLDVEMPEENGFALFNHFPVPGFKVIFVTAHNQYAIQALRLSALDYLLKPIDLEELEQAVARALDAPAAPPSHSLIEQAVRLAQQKELEKIAVPTRNGFEMVAIESIVRLESDSNYTQIHSVPPAKRVVTRPLAHFQDLLASSPFFRVHSSHLVHLKFVRRYIKGRGGHLEMEDGSIVPVAARKKNDFLKLMKMR